MKEWKGNSDSVRSRLAINKAHTTKGGETDDFYATDPEALQKLLDCCSGWLHNTLDMIKPSEGKILDKIHVVMPIWECACGNGNLSEVLVKNGFIVWATDLKDRGYGQNRDIDFLNTTKTNNPVILTNPPYSLANEFILHALDILPDMGVYIALMNISYLCGQKRYETIYSKGTLREVYLFRKRIECWRNNDKETYGGKAMVDFAWYVFQKGYSGQPTLYWL